MNGDIRAIAFDCYGTIVDFSDDHFARAYEEICREQGIAIDGKVFYEKWMEVWRRLASDGRTTDGGTVGVEPMAAVSAAAGESPNVPGPLSEAEAIPPHPEHHTPSAGRNRTLNGPLPPYRPYSEEWPEHFSLCFEELGLKGDAGRAYARLVEMLGGADAFPEARHVVESVGSRRPIALLSNADDNFLLPALSRNGFSFPIVVSSESAGAYKPHIAIFEGLSREIAIPRESILYVGDSRFADVAGAKNAGMLAAWVNRKGRRPLEAARQDGEARDRPGGAQRELPPPDFEIESLEALLEIVR
jgi:HAD superfamily hydrolase (TIGR01549 family)